MNRVSQASGKKNDNDLIEKDHNEVCNNMKKASFHWGKLAFLILLQTVSFSTWESPDAETDSKLSKVYLGD